MLTMPKSSGLKFLWVFLFQLLVADFVSNLFEVHSSAEYLFKKIFLESLSIQS